MLRNRIVGEFAHRQATSASADAIWALWADPASWSGWDLGLRKARSDAPLAAGTIGRIVPLRGSDARFIVREWRGGDRYVSDTGLTGARLVVERHFISRAPVVFEHRVWFEGPLARLWSRLLGPGFRRVLPPTMQKLATFAETEAAR